MTADEHQGIIGAVAGVTERVVASLPAQFLLLALVNVIFVIGLLWYLQRIDGNRTNAEIARMNLLSPLLQACVHPMSGH
jgi:hypothetical protein